VTRKAFLGMVAVAAGSLAMGACRHDFGGRLSPSYSEETAPQVFAWIALESDLLSIFGTSDGKRLWAVGEHGTILESGDGEHWTPRNSGTTNRLYSIFGTSDGKRLWAVGGNGTILESGDGEHWMPRTSGTTKGLLSIFGTSDGKRLWAVGEHGTILESGDGEHWMPRTSGTTKGLLSIFGTSDGKRLWAVGWEGTILESGDGEHWTLRTSGTTNYLYSIFGTSDGKRLWTVGENGTILESGGGEHWTPQTSGTTKDLRSIFGASDGKRLWAVGEKGTILESGDGEHWMQRNSGTMQYLYSIFGTSDGKRLWAVDEKGTILESGDGEHWMQRNSGTMQYLLSIFGTSDGKRLWAVGGNGTILESGDGEHWTPRTSGTTNHLYSIFGTSDGKRLWAVGEEGTILESSDGEHWTPRTSGTTNFMASIFGTSDGKRLWAVGEEGTILESSDGEHWTPRTSGTTNYLYSIFGTSDGKRLWAVGEEGTILESSDGEHWTPRTSGTTNHLYSIFGTSDGKRLWAVGGNGTILESGDGEHWMPRTSGTTEGLLSIFGTSDGKRLWAAGWEGTILESGDGEHWTLRTSGTTKGLRSIFGTSDGKQLWTVGENGTILESGGGEHWTPQTSGTTKGLRSIFGASDGKRLWAAGEGTILESGDGEHWTPRTGGTTNQLYSIFGTSDGKRLWAVGQNGAISRAVSQGAAPVVTDARLSSSLQVKIRKGAVAVNAITVEAISDLLSRHGSNWTKQAECKTSGQLGWWDCPAEMKLLEVKGGDTVRFRLTVDRVGGPDLYEFTTVYDPWSFVREHLNWFIVGGVASTWVGLLTVFLFNRPLWILKLHRLTKLNEIEKIKIPGLGAAGQFLAGLLTLLPIFVKHRRTLDAWIVENQALFRRGWEGHRETGYVPLPIRIGDPLSGELIDRPGPEDIRRRIAKPRSAIQIIGPGGAGKTTLTCQIASWAFDQELGDHPMLPVWVDEELDSDLKTLRSVVKAKLTAVLTNEDLEDAFFEALLKRQRILVIVDRLSERSAITQRHIENLYRSAKIGSLVLTSRVSRILEGVQSVGIYLQPLDSSTLLHFVTSLLRAYRSDEVQAKAFSKIKEQTDLGNRVASLISLRTDKGEEDVALVPLPVRLFVEQAIQLVRNGQSLDELPASLPEVYFLYLRRVNPLDSSVPHFLTGDQMLKIAKALGKVALQPDFVPKEFSRTAAVSALKAVEEPVTNTYDPIERLKLNGVLIEKQGGLDCRLRFALDPIAEFLAAAAYAEELGSSTKAWDDILESTKKALGFQSALKLVRQAYWAPLER